MPILSHVGRGSPGQRIARRLFYALLSIGAIGIVYPLLLVVGQAMSDRYDLRDNAIIPACLLDANELALKHVFSCTHKLPFLASRHHRNLWTTHPDMRPVACNPLQGELFYPAPTLPPSTETTERDQPVLPSSEPAPDHRNGFLVHVYQQERRGQTRVYGIGRLQDGRTFGIVERRLSPRFFVRERDVTAVAPIAHSPRVVVETSCRRTMDGETVVRLHGPSARALNELAKRLAELRVPTFEADIPLHRQYLMGSGLRGPVVIRGRAREGRYVDTVFIDPEVGPADFEPRLRLLSFDIETTPEHDCVTGFSAVLWSNDAPASPEEVHMVAAPLPAAPPHLHCHPDEGALLQAFVECIRRRDPDLLTGWNVLDFDLPVLEKRFKAHGIPFRLGRTRDASRILPGQRFGGTTAIIHGRQVIDAMHLVRRTLTRFDDFRLETVARGILGRGKKTGPANEADQAARIEELRRKNPGGFAEYCLEDARLVRDILAREQLVARTIRRATLTGLPLNRAWGSVAAFEFLYIGALHEREYVAPTLDLERADTAGAPGGLVLEPRAGLYTDVLVFDFKSLYPSIIRTFNIDPLAARQARDLPDGECVFAPNGVGFARGPAILPAMIEQFWRERDRAKAAGDDLASHTYKIVMNSFYGVLGTRSCRFGDSRLAGAITSFGHLLLRWCRDRLTGMGHEVIYGDTDSLFVAARLPQNADAAEAHQLGERLRTRLNRDLDAFIQDTYRLESRLEIEFETHYSRFLLPQARGQAGKGRAKGYAGLHRKDGKDVLDIVGMEAVRSDWTDMAHHFQENLLRLVFADAHTAEIEQFIRSWIQRLKRGELDGELVYRKRLRKRLDAYTRTTPPHVKAARLLHAPSGLIRYLITTDGPQPESDRTSPIDYVHYINKQIAPLLEAIAAVRDIDVAGAVRGEPRLF